MVGKGNYTGMEQPMPPLMLRRRDRWSLKVRLWRAARAGQGERRSSLVAAARAVALGAPVSTVDNDATVALSNAELRLIGGGSLELGRCHRPTVARLRAATEAGPVFVDRIADHGHCFGVYLRTAAGQRIAVLTAQLGVGSAGGGTSVDLRPLALA
ncbi:MAG TPA: hypothetical protein VFP61_11975 [Acidimicrobiales bacterium]|nr:hypothetical protein [Acidimicrobiales bacterium]